MPRMISVPNISAKPSVSSITICGEETVLEHLIERLGCDFESVEISVDHDHLLSRYFPLRNAAHALPQAGNRSPCPVRI